MESAGEWFILLPLFIPTLKNLTDELGAEGGQSQPGLP